MEFLKVLVTMVVVCSAADVPERFQRPRHFNHHPYTDVVDKPLAPANKRIDLPDPPTYAALLARLAPRALVRKQPDDAASRYISRQSIDEPRIQVYRVPVRKIIPTKEPDLQEPTAAAGIRIQQVTPVPIQDLIRRNSQYSDRLVQGVVPSAVVVVSPSSQNYVSTTVSPVTKPRTVKLRKGKSRYEDPYVKVPKNYAFSYAVKDEDSGDDFSHTQAHNGQATQGEYRVKLPDGRVQIVSYTADSQGYKADIKYEEEKPSPSPYNQVQVSSSPYNQVQVSPSPYNQVQVNQVTPSPQTPVVVKARPVYRVIRPHDPQQPYKAALIAYAPYRTAGSNGISSITPIYIYRAALPVHRIVNYPQHAQLQSQGI